MIMKLSPKQFSVYMKMEYTWKSAYELKSRLDILRAIVRKGYAEEKRLLGSNFFPHNRIMFRKTDKSL